MTYNYHFKSISLARLYKLLTNERLLAAKVGHIIFIMLETGPLVRWAKMYAFQCYSIWSKLLDL